MDNAEVTKSEVVSDPLAEMARILGVKVPGREGLQNTARCPYADEARAILAGE